MQIDCRRGALFGEASRDANKEPILYGLLKDPLLDVTSNLDVDLNDVSENMNTSSDKKDGITIIFMAVI